MLPLIRKARSCLISFLSPLLFFQSTFRPLITLAIYMNDNRCTYWGPNGLLYDVYGLRWLCLRISFHALPRPNRVSMALEIAYRHRRRSRHVGGRDFYRGHGCGGVADGCVEEVRLVMQSSWREVVGLGDARVALGQSEGFGWVRVIGREHQSSLSSPEDANDERNMKLLFCIITIISACGCPLLILARRHVPHKPLLTRRPSPRRERMPPDPPNSSTCLHLLCAKRFLGASIVFAQGHTVPPCPFNPELPSTFASESAGNAVGYGSHASHRRRNFSF